MQKYLGAKLIEAEPLNLGEYNERRGWTISENENPAKKGYYIVYPDGYVSWSPKEIFEEAYRKTDALSFGLAIEALKKNMRVARAGWNGKNMWLSYVDPYNNKQFTLVEKEIEGTFAPYIGMKTADNKYVPWLASQTDILADDFMIVE